MERERSLRAEHGDSPRYSASTDALSAAEYRAVVEDSPVMMWRTAPDARCDYLSNGWLLFTGRPLDQQLGYGWAEWVHADDRDALIDGYLSSFRKRQPFDLEYRLRRNDGAYRWIVDSGKPRYDDSGAFIGYIGGCLDVDARFRAYRENEPQWNKTSMLFRELVSSLAHEVSQPMTAALASAVAGVRLCDLTAPDLRELREVTAVTRTELTRASEIIDRVRSLYTTGEPSRERVDVNDLVRTVVSLTRRDATRQGASLHTDLEPALPPVVGDRVQLQQVLVNLVRNAIEATVNAQDEVIVSSRRSDDQWITVSVSDSGVGLPDDAVRIFESFVTTKPHGTGMGLAISRRVIEAHGGRLWAERNPGRGSIFTFTLPLTPD